MKRLLIAGAILVAFAGWADARPLPAYPDYPPAAFDPYLTWPYPLSDTARRSIVATPDCGAANPQGGIPSAATWGDCP